MKKYGRYAGALAVAGIFLAGYLLILLPGGQARGSGAETTAPFTVDGTLESDEIDVAGKLPGRVEELLAREGDFVEAGQLLAVLETDEIDAKREQAEAGVKAYEALAEKGNLAVELERRTAESRVLQARAGLDAAKAAQGMAERQLEALENGARPQQRAMIEQKVASARAMYDTALKTWTRVKNLADEGVLAQQKADETEMKYLAARAQLEAAKAERDMVFEGPRREEVEAARLQLQQARAGVDAAERTLLMTQDALLMVEIRRMDADAAGQQAAAGRGVLREVDTYMENTRITSPVKGRISQRMVGVGEVVSPGYALFCVTRTTGYRVDVFVDESRLDGRGPGDEVDVELPALGMTYPGEVTEIMPAAEFATHKATNENGSYDVMAIQLRISLPKDLEDLPNGITARVHFR